MSDPNQNIPTDNNPPTANELKIVNSLFPVVKKNVSSIFSNMKDILIAGIIFFVVSMPFIDNILGGCLNFVKNSSIMMIGAKSILFMILFFVVQNFFLAKKK